jgi:hypothetical protein
MHISSNRAEHMNKRFKINRDEATHAKALRALDWLGISSHQGLQTDFRWNWSPTLRGIYEVVDGTYRDGDAEHPHVLDDPAERVPLRALPEARLLALQLGARFLVRLELCRRHLGLRRRHGDALPLGRHIPGVGEVQRPQAATRGGENGVVAPGRE